MALDELPAESSGDIAVGQYVPVTIDGVARKAQIRWIAGIKNSAGELIKREFDLSGNVVEGVLGKGMLEDYFPDAPEGARYLIGVKFYTYTH